MSKCTCSLHLGLHPFPQNVNQTESLLEKRFQSEMFSFYNATKKVQEKLPLFETLHIKTEESYFNESSPTFRLFPPVILPETNSIPGFPRDFIESDEASDKSIEKNKWFSGFSERYAEQIFGQGFINHFTKHPDIDGFLFHPYCSETYLKPIIKKASIKRESEAKYKKCIITVVPLSETELRICDSLGINLRDLIQVSELDYEELTLFAEKLTQRAVKDNKEIHKNLIWGRANLNTNIEIRNHIAYKFYLSQIQARNFETDMLLVLKDYQAIVDIEIKSTPDNQNKSIKSMLEKASTQLKKANQTLSWCHRDILNENWNLVRVIGIPNIDKTVIDESTCCQHCSQFLIDESAVKDISNWIRSLTNSMNIIQHTGSGYRTLFTRVVGFASISNSLQKNVSLTLSDSRIEYEKAITGKDKGVTSEETLSGESLPENIDGHTLSKIKKEGCKHLSSLSVLFYWNPSQLSVLLNKKEKNKRVLLDSDFGCGKTLLMKHFASLLAEYLDALPHEGDHYKPKVFFVSLSAAKEQNIHAPSKNEKIIYSSYQRPAVIDVSNQMEFEGTSVQVVDLKDLIHHSYGNQTKTVNDLLVSFMRGHPEDHFFIDELSVISTRGQLFQGPDLAHLTDQRSQNCNIWIALRPSELAIDRYEEYTKDAEKYKEKLRNAGFHTPVLNQNMRNASSVIEGLNSQYSRRQREHLRHHEQRNPDNSRRKGVLKLTIPKAPLPPNTVAGNMPVVIRITSRLPKAISKVVVPTIEKYFIETSEPVVVLVTDRKILEEVVEECRALKDKRNITSYCTRAVSFKEDDIEKLKGFLSSPEGVLITDAEAFGGMQARNIIVVRAKSLAIRNYIMRAVSQVIVIQTYGKRDKSIDQNPNIKVDRSFLTDVPQNDGIQNKNNRHKRKAFERMQPLLWLWHLPSGTTERDIEDHFSSKSHRSHLIQITTLEHRNNFIGYRLTVESAFVHIFLDCSGLFWPPGWIARRYKDSRHEFQRSQMAPQDIKLVFAKHEEEITHYAQEGGVTVLEVSRLLYKTGQVDRWNVRVHEADYKKVIDPEFWKLSGWKVKPCLERDKKL